MSEIDLKKLADILEQRERAKKRRTEEDNKMGENWLTGDIMYVFRPCSLYQQSPEVPPKMRTGSRGASAYSRDGSKHLVLDSWLHPDSAGRQKLRHIYDGVYASPEERVAGGGCLSLVDTVTEALGLTKGDNQWNLGYVA